MRIAVLVYGRLNKCAEHYNNIMEHIGKQHTIDFFASSDNSSQSLLNDFIRLYKPISYNNDSIYYTCDLTKYLNRRIEITDDVLDKLTRHYINKGRVFSLLETYLLNNTTQYDIVLSLRIDCVYYNSFDFKTLEDNTIYIPVNNDYGGINDQIAYGKIDVMKKYNSIFSKILFFLDNNISEPHSECLHYANINYCKLIIKRINLYYYLDR
jgi:hypothetical protein